MSSEPSARDKELSLLEHLVELKNRVIVAAVAVLITTSLAFIYATQKPPSTALARWHYKKALSSGAPKNVELEKILGDAK